MLEGFTQKRSVSGDCELSYRIGGEGPPLLLLHGYPQTHVMWHRVAPRLARTFTIICADLRGYGDSAKPPSDATHEAYSKRAMAGDMARLMTELGCERFMVAGHDRGARVAHRLCLDHPERVTRAALLDIVPTLTLFRATDAAFAKGYYHWFFLSQPEPLPEHLIGAEPLFYLHAKLGHWSATKDRSSFAPDALAEYERCWTPETIHASCEDYRAAATIDLEHDAADEHRKIVCPVLILWGERGLMHKLYDVTATWREKADGPVAGRALPCGHFLAEEEPEATAEALAAFFAS